MFFSCALKQSSLQKGERKFTTKDRLSWLYKVVKVFFYWSEALKARPLFFIPAVSNILISFIVIDTIFKKLSRIGLQPRDLFVYFQLLFHFTAELQRLPNESFFLQNSSVFTNIRTPIWHLCRKTTVLICHRYLINTRVEKMNNI
jgi:hypothetical protein